MTDSKRSSFKNALRGAFRKRDKCSITSTTPLTVKSTKSISLTTRCDNKLELMNNDHVIDERIRLKTNKLIDEACSLAAGKKSDHLNQDVISLNNLQTVSSSYNPSMETKRYFDSETGIRIHSNTCNDVTVSCSGQEKDFNKHTTFNCPTPREVLMNGPPHWREVTNKGKRQRYNTIIYENRCLRKVEVRPWPYRVDTFAHDRYKYSQPYLDNYGKSAWNRANDDLEKMAKKDRKRDSIYVIPRQVTKTCQSRLLHRYDIKDKSMKMRLMNGNYPYPKKEITVLVPGLASMKLQAAMTKTAKKKAETKTAAEIRMEKIEQVLEEQKQEKEAEKDLSVEEIKERRKDIRKKRRRRRRRRRRNRRLRRRRGDEYMDDEGEMVYGFVLRKRRRRRRRRRRHRRQKKKVNDSENKATFFGNLFSPDKKKEKRRRKKKEKDTAVITTSDGSVSTPEGTAVENSTSFTTSSYDISNTGTTTTTVTATESSSSDFAKKEEAAKVVEEDPTKTTQYIASAETNTEVVEVKPEEVETTKEKDKKKKARDKGGKKNKAKDTDGEPASDVIQEETKEDRGKDKKKKVNDLDVEPVSQAVDEPAAVQEVAKEEKRKGKKKKVKELNGEHISEVINEPTVQEEVKESETPIEDDAGKVKKKERKKEKGEKRNKKKAENTDNTSNAGYSNYNNTPISECSLNNCYSGQQNRNFSTASGFMYEREVITDCHIVSDSGDCCSTGGSHIGSLVKSKPQCTNSCSLATHDGSGDHVTNSFVSKKSHHGFEIKNMFKRLVR